MLGVVSIDVIAGAFMAVSSDESKISLTVTVAESEHIGVLIDQTFLMLIPPCRQTLWNQDRSGASDGYAVRGFCFLRGGIVGA